MSDVLTARAVRDAARTLTYALAMCSAFVVVVLPITTVAVVYTAAKWRIESMQADFREGLQKAAAERAEKASR